MITKRMPGMNCSEVIVSCVTGVRKREDQSQNSKFQSYIFEKWEEFQREQKWPILDVNFKHSENRMMA